MLSSKTVRTSPVFWATAAFVVFALTATEAVVQREGQVPPQVTLSVDAVAPGDVLRVEVIGSDADRVSAEFLGQTLTFAYDTVQNRWRALAGVDLDVKPATHRLVVRRNGESAERAVKIVPKEFRVRRLTVADQFVNVPDDVAERIARENKLLSEIYARTTQPRWRGAFVLPVNGTPTSNFGVRSYYNGQRRAPHAGVDFTSEAGTPVRASNHGAVALASPLYFTGNTVVLDHGGGLLSVFAHLSEIHVRQGDLVAHDTIIGLVGATGRVTGPHLHWSVRLNGARVDPISLVAATRPD